jgi:hypothetical protein
MWGFLNVEFLGFFFNSLQLEFFVAYFVLFSLTLITQFFVWLNSIVYQIK